MNIKEKLPVVVVTTLLIINCFLIFVNPEPAMAVINIISLCGPLLIVWMVYSVLKFGKYKGTDLKENEEWGYADKSKDDLGVF